MQQFEWIHAAWLALAIVLEIVANVFLKFSDGFRRKFYGLMSIAAVLGAFSALSQAVQRLDRPGSAARRHDYDKTRLMSVSTSSSGSDIRCLFYCCASASSLSRKPVTDRARLSARHLSLADGAEL